MPTLPVRRALLLVIGAVVLYACSERITDPASTPSATPQLSIRGAGRDLGPAISAQSRHTDALLQTPGVVGTAIGLMSDGRPGVQILLERDGVGGLPATLDGVPVSTQVIGRVVAFSDPTTRQRPAPLGYSVGHPLITAGTIGARVKDAAGHVYILSNNHVLANQNAASIGDAEYQPGPFDGGTAADQIATLADFQTILFNSSVGNYVDAAIALTTASQTANFTPSDDAYGLPNSKMYGDADNNGLFDDRNALLGLNVQKYGRTTHLTHGQITGVNATITVCYSSTNPCNKSAKFIDQLIITPGTFSGGGDSGSLIVTDDANRNPVALLFAGSATQTIANRIDYVLGRFKVTIDGTAPPVTDLAVSVNAPASATVGDVVNVVITVSNVGNQDVVSVIPVALVELKSGGGSTNLGLRTIAGGLAAGASTTVTYSLPSAGAPLGPHVLVGLQGVSDANAANNFSSVTVTLSP